MAHRERLSDDNDFELLLAGAPATPIADYADFTGGAWMGEARGPSFVGGSFTRESTYLHSNMAPRNSDPALGGTRLSSSGGDVFVRGSLLDRHIEATVPTKGGRPERARDYKGRIRRWPGVLFVVLMLGGAGFAATYYGLEAHNASEERATTYEQAKFNATMIAGGNDSTKIDDDIVEDDGVVGNPKKYPRSECELPDYQSKNGHIVAVSKNGTEVNMKIKGINWFGMETGQAMPFGLWENSDNGTSAYQIASFLARNRFNGVRLPLMADSILNGRTPNIHIFNRNENRAIDATSYMSLLKGMVKSLQFRHIGVLLSMHTLTLTDNGKLWYNDVITEEKFLSAIDVLTKELCDSEYWNIMGIDLKNEPYYGTWGDETARDFRAGSRRIADRMLKGCPNWLGFVEGVNAQHTIEIDGEEFGYYDWFGGGLQAAKKYPLEFSVPNKIVWAPHYYTPAVFPQYYLFGGGKVVGNAIIDYIELDDDKLRRRIEVTMDDMFGFLASETGHALLLGEFGGLYAEDKHPKKTTKRCTDFTIEIIKQSGWAGGFVWSLNPESEYQYNPADTPGRYFEGVVELDWLSANPEFLKGMAAMDDMEGLQQFPCFPKTS